ncbi:MAG: alpha/beta hydrolase [Armatimonadia bacterium]
MRCTWWNTLTGFTGLGGIRWIASILCDRHRPDAEDIAPEDLRGADCSVLRVAGNDVVYCRHGEGTPVLVFIHGFGERLQIWQPIQQALAGRYPSVSLDLWGFGAAPRPEGITPRDWVTEVMGLLDALGIDRAIFIGHSLGARVSLMCARAHPDRIAGLVLCDADWGQAPHGYVLVSMLARTPLLPRIVRGIRTRRDHLERLVDMVWTPNFVLNECDLQALHQPLRVKGTEACWRSLASAPPLRDVRRLAEDVKAPSLVIWGADDPVVPLWAGQKLACKLHAELKVLPNCGHFSPEEYPAQVTQWIEEFLAATKPYERLPAAR